ncbi:MAG: flagellar basal body P-ring protein FlgI, partial [Hypericibacter sp.]
VDGARDNVLTGYGIVVGLAGTGDSSRSKATQQSVANALMQFGLSIPMDRLASRNTAAVMLTASLPAFTNSGDKIDINVASIGDARSLAGGTLIATPLLGPDQKIHALAQGPVSIGGFRYDAFGNLVQKNHPTTGIVAAGGIIELPAVNTVVTRSGAIHLLLNAPDFTTSSKIADALAREFGQERLGRDITAEGPDRVIFRMKDDERARYVEILRRIEALTVIPDQVARVVVNERTGTVVSGGDVRLGQVSVTQGELRIAIDTDYLVSQPASFLYRPSPSVRTAVVPDVTMNISEPEAKTVAMPAGTSVTDLALALNKIKATPRDIISILQAIQRAGALHAELVVQ